MADQEIYMIIDGSGSMGGVKQDVVDGVNTFIQEQKDDATATGDSVVFTLTVFDDRVSNIIHAEDITLVNPVSVSDTFRGGSTALLDAIGKTISTVDADTGRKLVVVYTDGHENASIEFKNDEIKKLIEELQGKNNWTFVYMSAELADFAQPASLGFVGTNTMSGTSRMSTSTHFAGLSQGASNMRSSGVSSSSSFYQDNLDDAVAFAASTGGSYGDPAMTGIPALPPTGDPGDETDKKDRKFHTTGAAPKGTLKLWTPKDDKVKGK